MAYDKKYREDKNLPMAEEETAAAADDNKDDGDNPSPKKRARTSKAPQGNQQRCQARRSCQNGHDFCHTQDRVHGGQ
ncbi:hypothetical protein C7999DRAFT_35486 [Corynascus novoguineensis]|uniref:Uncharacterized protein n=1 Tax=Corynascus novoguineensis TaxID=1126955 RepID=A0AAN7CNW7_9PEZI|nr:hypothetical protein C7999DRAFT_35486 [Corynascus novoguineensis]